jgi:membrane protease subunit HflC
MNRRTLVGIGIAAAVILFILLNAAFTVRQTKQALVLQFGNPIRIERDPGLKFKIPFLQRVEMFDKQILELDPPPQEVLLADQKRINVDAFARYRITDPLRFRQRAVTEENFRQIFGAQLNSAVRGDVARIGLAELLSVERAGIMERIAKRLKDQAPDFGVEVVDVRIGRADLPEAASQSVYNRMRSARVAQASQLRAEGEEQKARIQAEADRDRTVILADANRQAQIFRGEGEAERTRVLNQAYGQDPAFFDFFRSLQAYEALATSGTTMVLRPDSDFFRFFGDQTGGAAAAGHAAGRVGAAAAGR